MVNAPTLQELADDLASGRTTAVALLEDCLAAIADPAGEGARVFVHVAAEEARTAARAMDALRQVGAEPSAFAGIPVSVKDLFDVRGQVTRAGSRVLDGAPPATRDATIVNRLRQAGFVVIGRTNMTEFAFSGVGVNPHYGTPLCVWDRAVGRAPGGSSSGAAISVGDGMAHAAIGSDTGGSCRIPAAFNGLVGFKPTTRRIPRDGTVPLSFTLDSIGPLARSSACCAIVDAVMAGEPASAPAPREIDQLRILVPRNHVLEHLDPATAQAFEETLTRLSRAGAKISEMQCDEIAAIPRAVENGNFSGPESFAWHRPLIEAARALYDPRVLMRIEQGGKVSAADYVDLRRNRKDLAARFEQRMQNFDLVAFPTAPIVPPPLDAFTDDAEFFRLNALILRNPSVINFLDGCAISIPMTRRPQAPVGLMLAGAAGGDRNLFACAAAVEALLAD